MVLDFSHVFDGTLVEILQTTVSDSRDIGPYILRVNGVLSSSFDSYSSAFDRMVSIYGQVERG